MPLRITRTSGFLISLSSTDDSSGCILLSISNIFKVNIFPISYNPDDPRQLVVQTSGGKLVYIQPEFNPDTSGLVDIRMIDPSNPALNESVYSMTPDNIEHTLSGLKNAIDWNSKGDLNDSQFIERKESEIRFMASNDPYISSQMILFNKLHGRMPEIKLQPNALGRFYQKLYNRTYPSGSTYEIVWE